MAKIDPNQYMEQCGVRKARFGGYEPEDVRAALRGPCAATMNRVLPARRPRPARPGRKARRCAARCQTLLGQNQNLAAQNATLAGQTDKIARRQDDLAARYAKVQERNHSLTDQVAVLRLKNSDLTREKQELNERAENAEAALRIKGRAHDEARQKLGKRPGPGAGAGKRRGGQDPRPGPGGRRRAAGGGQPQGGGHRPAWRGTRPSARRARWCRPPPMRRQEIQNAHRLRLQDLQSRITAMEQQRDKLLDFLAEMIGELQEAQDYARPEQPAGAPTGTWACRKRPSRNWTFRHQTGCVRRRPPCRSRSKRTAACRAPAPVNCCGRTWPGRSGARPGAGGAARAGGGDHPLAGVF